MLKYDTRYRLSAASRALSHALRLLIALFAQTRVKAGTEFAVAVLERDVAN